MRITPLISSLSLGILLLCACTSQGVETPANTIADRNTPDRNTPDSNEMVLADTFFFGCAYLDANSNGELDENDPKLVDMHFTITLAGGGGFGGRTPEKGCAMVIIPGGLEESHWPVKARMLPPEGSSYELIGEEEILLEYPKTHADFLYTER